MRSRRAPGTLRLSPITAAVLTAFSVPVLAQAEPAPQQLDALQVIGERPYSETESASPKLTEPLRDTPRTVNILTSDLLEEQGRRSLVDALRNITGIAIQAGEGNPPGGDQFKIRGFLARDAVFVDGARQPGSFYRDPFNTETIEVIKGPAGAFTGAGSAGGSVNLVSKQPMLDHFTRSEMGVGSDSQVRAAVDVNHALGESTSLRLNAVGHRGDVAERDEVNYERFGFAPSLAFGLGTPSRLTLSYEYNRQDNLPDYGIPNVRETRFEGSGFEGRRAPSPISAFYGYANDYEDVDAHLATVRYERDISEHLGVRNQLRAGRTARDMAVSAPRFLNDANNPNNNTITEQTQVRGNRKYRDQTDEILINQTDLTLRLVTGSIEHTLVTGVELSAERTENRRRLDDNGPAYNLLNPGPIQSFEGNINNFNGTRVKLDTDRVGVYVIDTLKFNPQWALNLGLRFEEVESRVRGIDDSGTAPGFVTNLETRDSVVSGNAGLVFKPVEAGTLYLGYGSGFETSGRADIVQVAGGNNNPPSTAAAFQVDPEETETVELGTKWDLLGGQFSFNAAIFRVEKRNVRTPGLPGEPAIVLDGEQRADGFELSLAGSITPDWNFFGGYSYLDGEVRASNNLFEIGQGLDNTPKHSVSFWSTYSLNPRIQVAGGGQYVGERVSNIRPDRNQNVPIVAPGYAVFDAMLKFKLSGNAAVRLNAYNLADKAYTLELASAQSIPGPGRSAVISLDYEF